MGKFTFFKGILLGSVAGGITALLTAKQAGSETQAQITDYLNGISEASQDVSDSLNRVQTNLHHLSTDGLDLLKSATDDIQKSVSDYQFQAEPRVKQIQEHVEELSDKYNIPVE